jgi:hypothetical protein
MMAICFSIRCKAEKLGLFPEVRKTAEEQIDKVFSMIQEIPKSRVPRYGAIIKEDAYASA